MYEEDCFVAQNAPRNDREAGVIARRTLPKQSSSNTDRIASNL